MRDIQPNDVIYRAPTPDDAAAVVELINACSIAQGGAADFTLPALRGDWDDPALSLATDAWVAVGPDAQLLGYEQIDLDPAGRAHEIGGYVHPEHEGCGIGTRLLRLAEQRARAVSASVAQMRGSIEATNSAAQHLFAAEGYRAARHFWRMEIDLDAPPPAPVWPAGIAVRTFVPGQDERATYEAVEEAFQDHWGHTRLPFEEWSRGQSRRPDFDPALWFLAIASRSPAPHCVCHAPNLWLGCVAWECGARGVAVGLAWHYCGTHSAPFMRAASAPPAWASTHRA